MNACIRIVTATLLASVGLHAQIESGSNGSDGPFTPTESIVVDMADHPDGIYHYTEINIPVTVEVTFIPNAKNTPVVWLVQDECVINGHVNVSGQHGITVIGGVGGPGGFRGGNGGTTGNNGLGPGAGLPAAYGSLPKQFDGSVYTDYHASGSVTYGNMFILPILGGSGGDGVVVNSGGGTVTAGGGGGGGAILIASSKIKLDGFISSVGGFGGFWSSGPVGGYGYGGGGSGGAIRLVARELYGSGVINTIGGTGGPNTFLSGGEGRVRFDVLDNAFGGSIIGVFSQGVQPIVIPQIGQGIQLTVISIGGVPVSQSPTGQLTTPDAVLSAQQANPVPIVVQCTNLALNTQITVTVRPANGPVVSGTGYNNSGTLSSSTATVLVNMLRGGGIIYATATN